MSVLSRFSIVIASFLVVLSTMGCEKVDEAKGAASGMIQQSIDEAKQTIGLSEPKEQGEEGGEEGGEEESGSVEEKE